MRRPVRLFIDREVCGVNCTKHTKFVQSVLILNVTYFQFLFSASCVIYTIARLNRSDFRLSIRNLRQTEIINAIPKHWSTHT